ncbi:hypothetical protein ART_1841 [Arthrobacter sp. PAMC 25486]|nr:hypothetical protein ART_1841 [Arthrobacter sp. PAMC 25486]
MKTHFSAIQCAHQLLLTGSMTTRNMFSPYSFSRTRECPAPLHRVPSFKTVRTEPRA